MTTLTKTLPQTDTYIRSPSILDSYKEKKNEEDETEEFPHGWRRFVEVGPHGETIYRDVPLAPEDFLDPQEGDQMPQGLEHAQIAIALYNKLEKHFDTRSDILVTFDTKILWGIPNLKEPFPDVTVIPDVKDKTDSKTSFDCKKQGTRPCLIIEVMSPGYLGDDTDKVKIYEQAGVSEYIIINPHVKAETKPFELTGYRLRRWHYQPIQPNAQGQLLSQTTGVLVSLSGANKRKIELIDKVTGKRLLSNKEEKVAHLAEQKARLKAEFRADSETQRANQAEGKIYQVVQNMLSEGFSTEMVSNLMGLHIDEVEKLATQPLSD